MSLAATPLAMGAGNARSAAPAALSYSSASAAVVQPQPAPGRCHARAHGEFAEPDRACTPGALNPAVTPRTLRSTICRSGWTRTVRPPDSVTEREKRASLAAYGDGGSLSSYEYDHLVPLELGGAVNDARNLWPEPAPTPNRKDTLEGRLRRLVCAGHLGLAVAQLAIARDWVAAYRRYVG